MHKVNNYTLSLNEKYQFLVLGKFEILFGNNFTIQNPQQSNWLISVINKLRSKLHINLTSIMLNTIFTSIKNKELHF